MEQLDRPIVDIEIELEAHAEENVGGVLHVRNARIAKGTEVDRGVVVADVVHRAGRNRDAGPQILVGIPAEGNKLQAELARFVYPLQNPHPLSDDLGTDAIACDDGDFFRHCGRGLYGFVSSS